jgi:phosphatidylinositol glycan class N
MVITASSVSSLQAKAGLPILNQVSGWVVLAVSSVYPFVSSTKHFDPSSKFLMFFLGFGTCFVILSISVEGLFYLALSATLALWIEMEAVLRTSSTTNSAETKSYTFRADDLRIALFFLFFVQTSFFGTGK